MIQSKKDYQEYLEADMKALNLQGSSFFAKMTNPVYQFQRALRRHEYYHNCCRHIWQKPMRVLAGRKHRKLGVKYGFSIPINVFGKGLNIAHIGTIIVNGYVRVGDYCRLHACTNIGTAAGKPDATPKIGNRVYIGPGAKLFGDIVIADDIAIGANAVVNKSFETAGIAIGGIPAKKINDKGSKGLLYAPKE